MLCIQALEGFLKILLNGLLAILRCAAILLAACEEIAGLSYTVVPARSLAPTILSGSVGDLWLYWSATFIGTSIVAILYRKKMPYQ